MILRIGRNPARRRAGFTILEILLASLIAALLLAALYMSLNMTLQQTQATRDAVEAEDLSRSVFNKIAIDLTGTLAPLPPQSGGNASAPPPASGATTPAATDPAATGSATPDASTTPAATDPAATDPAADATMPAAADNATAVAADFASQGGIIGEATKLVIYAGKVPEAFGRTGNPGEQVRSDQRQIIYWLEPGRGLFRRERPWVTADGVRNSIDTDPDAPDAVLLADEVTELLFEFSDGTSWTGSWDGTVPGPDTKTPLGPPRAIRVNLTLRIPLGRGEPLTRQVSQVIVVRSAPGLYTPPLLEARTESTEESGAAATPADTSGMSGTSGATGGVTGGTTGGSTGGKTGGTTPSGSTGGGKTGGATGGGTTGGAAPSGSVPSGGKTGGATGGGTTGGRTGGGK